MGTPLKATTAAVGLADQVATKTAGHPNEHGVKPGDRARLRCFWGDKTIYCGPNLVLWAHFSNKDVLCTVYVDHTWWEAISEFWHDGWQTVMGTKLKFDGKGKGKGKEKKGVAEEGKGDGKGGKTILLQPDANAHYKGVIGEENGKGKGILGI